MAESSLETPLPADPEAAVAALPAKKEAVREAFDRLAACSPFPLPFTWEDLDGHISAVQSSISRRFRQLQVLEAARPACAVPTAAETRSEDNHSQQLQEEEEEVVVVEEEVEVSDEEDEEREGEEEEVLVEVEESDDEEHEVREEGEEVQEEEVEVEVVEEEEEVVVEAEDGTRDEGEQEADEEMQLTNEEELEISRKAEEQNADEEVVTKNDKQFRKEIDEEAHEEGEKELGTKEEEEYPCLQPGGKSSLKAGMTHKEIQPALLGCSKDLTAVCATMDASTLAKYICSKSNTLFKELPVAMRHAPDASALVLQVIKLFLSSKTFKDTKVWKKCTGLIRCLPAAASKPSADTIEQAKQVARDWKEMIHKLDCPGDLDLLSTWGLLYFLVSYNIAPEFDTSEIFCLFSMVPRHMQRKNTVELCKGLGIADRITDLIDYLIGKGHELDVFHLANTFNLSDKYPLLHLLKGYIETAKQNSKDIQSKSLISNIPKEIANLWFAHHLAKQKITDFNQCSTIIAEIQNLLDGYARTKKYLATARTSNSQTQQKQDNKKRKKEKQDDFDNVNNKQINSIIRAKRQSVDEVTDANPVK